MFHKVRWALALTALVLGTACGGGTPSASSSGPIVIGASVGMTGILAPWDQPANVMAQFAVDDFNAKGGILGRQIQLVTADTKSDRSLGATTALEVINKGAKMVMVACDFDYGSPSALVAQSKGLVSFSTCAADPKFGVQGIGPLAFTMSTGTPAQGALMAEWAYNKQGYKSAFLFLDTTVEYDKSLCGYFQKRFTELGGPSSITQDTFKNDDPSVATQITRFKALSPKPAAILMCSYGTGGASAIKQLRAAGIDAPILGSESMDGDYWINAVPNLSNWFHAAYGSIWGDDPNPKINELVKRYIDKEGKKPDIGDALTGYSVIEAYLTAVKRANSTDGQAVKAELEKYNLEPFTVGATTFSPSLHMSLVGRPMAIIGCQNGKFKFIEYYAAQKVPAVTF